MQNPDPHGAWDAFWAREKRTANPGGCLPAGYRGIESAQIAIWQSFAQSLPRKARVLDLATGDGRVMRWMLHKRRDLRVEGTDRARELPDPPRGARVHGGVASERLAFRDHAFDAITSQFGFEYGDIKASAAEAARVLRPGGRLALLTHRKDGPILAHNLARREAILWAIEKRDLPTIAKNSLRLRQLGLAPMPEAVQAAPAQGAAQFGAQSAAWEIAEAIRRTPIMGARDHPANVAATIDAIVEQARNELGRIASLEMACEATAHRASFDRAIEAAGFARQHHEEVIDPQSGRCFADFALYRRA